jgi:TM2 domain/Protein of unknown function (DUF2510)
MSTIPDNPSAGWYSDPEGSAGQRYWDGHQWSDYPASADALGNVPSSGVPAVQPGVAGYGVDAYGRPLSDKSKLVAGLLQIFISPFAVGRFYLGYNNIAILQIVVTFCTCFLGAWWPIIDGIMIIMGKVPDPQGRTLRD